MAPLGKEEMFFSVERFRAQLVVAFGGRVAEKRVTGTLSSGASSDLKQATEIAKQMVLDLGMGEHEYVAWGSDQGPIFLGGEISRRKDFSEETARQLENKVEGILRESYERATEMVDEHWHAVEAVATSLRKVETIDGALVKKAYEMAEAGETTEVITQFIVDAIAEHERKVAASAERHKARAEEEQRREEAQARPPSAPSNPRPATEGPRG